jgi:tetratricopeptide (TPR) repeat protein
VNAGIVFISYAHREDLDFTRQLATDLERDGFTVFFDQWDIQPGDGLVQRLDEGLRSASAGLIIYGQSAAGSHWVATEYAALFERKQRGEVQLIPVLRDDVPLPPILGTQVFADFRYFQSESEYESCLKELERALRGQRPERSPRPPGASARTFQPDHGRRPEGPRRVTLAIEPGRVILRSRLGDESVPHAGPGHRVRDRLWLVQRERRRLGTRSGPPDSAASGVTGNAAELQAALLQLGQAMGNQFLAGPVSEKLAAELADADRQNAVLQVALEVPEGADLANLPWETMCLAGGDEPLVLHPRVHFYRFVPGLGSTAAISIPEPLRILAVIASPEHGSGELLDYEAELDRMLRAVDRARREERAHVRVLEWGSVEAIRSALSEERYHILHISGQAGSGELILETADGQPDPVNAERFADEVLVPDQGVPLVVLAGCAASGGPDPDASGMSLSALARGLLGHGVPAVMAMSADVSDRYAIQLCSHFYQSLASRRQAPDPLAALADARRDLERTRAARPADHPESALAEWWIPALHMRTAPGPLFERGAASAPAAAAASSRAHGRRAGRGDDDFVGRRGDLRKLLRVLRGREPAVIVYGIGGMGKTSLANRLKAALGGEIDLVLDIPGRRITPTEILQELGLGLRSLCVRRQLDDDDPLSRASRELRDPRQDWGDQLRLAEDLVFEHVSVLLVLDEAEQSMRDADQGTRNDAPGEFTDPEMAAFIDRWTALSPDTRLLVTSRYPIALRDEVMSRVTLHHLGPLSRAETDKLMWRLTALDALAPDERDRAYADVGGHPRALEYLDSLLRGHRARFTDFAGRMEAALRAGGIENPSAWLGQGPRGLDQALAETVTLIVDDVLVDRLLIRLQSFPLALRLFVAASVFRTPVDAAGFNWAVAESLAPATDEVREARLGEAYAQLTAAQQDGRGLLLEHLGLPGPLLAELRRDCATQGRPEERPGLTHAIEVLVSMSLLSEVPDSPPGDPRYLVHRWTAQGLRYQIESGLASLVEPEDLTEAHRRAAAYYEWRADIWPDPVADLLEARHHHQEIGEHEQAAAATVRAAAILFRRGAFSFLRRLCGETLPDVAGDPRLVCDLLHWQSRAAQAQGELDAASRLSREALAAAQPEDTRRIAIGHERLADIATGRSEYDAARQAYFKALDLARDLRDPIIEARCYQGLGMVALARGDDDEAARWSRGALNYCSPIRIGAQKLVIDGVRQLRDLARARGESQDAARLALAYSERQAEYYDLEQVAGQSQLQIGKLSLRRDDLKSAETAFEAAKESAIRSRDRVMTKDCYLQLGRTWQRRGMRSRAQESYLRYISLADDMGDRPGTVDCYHQMGELAAASGDLGSAAVWHDRALKLAEQLAQPRLLAEAHRQLAKTSLARGDLESARASYLSSQQIGEQSGDPQIIVSSRLGLAEVELQSGQLVTAEEIYRDCRQLARQAHDQADVVRCQIGLATIARRRGDYDDALHLFTEARDSAARMGNQAVALDCLIELGVTAGQGPEAAAAADYYRRALEIAERLQDGMKTADLCCRLGNLYVAFGTKMEWYRRAAETFEAIGYLAAAADLWLQIGRVAGNYDLAEAERCCSRVLDLTDRDEDSPLTAEAYLELARCARKQGDHKAAYGSWLTADQLAQRLQQDDLTARTCQEGGLIGQLNGEPAETRELHGRALNLADRIGDQDTMIASCRDLGRLARWAGDDGRGSLEHWYRRALDLARQRGDGQAIAACAQQLLLAAMRAADTGRAGELLAADPVLVGSLGPDLAPDSGLARRRGELGAALTRDGRPDEALGFTTASMLAWLQIDQLRAEEQQGWLRRQRTELGRERFAELLREFLDAGIMAAVLEVAEAGETGAAAPGATGAGDAGSAEVGGEADGGQDSQHGQ